MIQPLSYFCFRNAIPSEVSEYSSGISGRNKLFISTQAKDCLKWCGLRYSIFEELFDSKIIIQYDQRPVRWCHNDFIVDIRHHRRCRSKLFRFLNSRSNHYWNRPIKVSRDKAVIRTKKEFKILRLCITHILATAVGLVSPTSTFSVMPVFWITKYCKMHNAWSQYINTVTFRVNRALC